MVVVVFCPSAFSQRTLWCRVCISNENLWRNTCTELSKTRQHLLCCCEAEVSCVEARDPLWLYPHSRQQHNSSSFLRNTWHRRFVRPFTERCETINANYYSWLTIWFRHDSFELLLSHSLFHSLINTLELLTESSGSHSALAVRALGRIWTLGCVQGRSTADCSTVFVWGNASRLHYIAHQQVRWHPHKKARYATPHTCKYTPGEPMIAQWGCCTRFVIHRLLENHIFIVLMSPARERARRQNRYKAHFPAP